MSQVKSRPDKNYIAPQLTVREKLTAGVFILLDTGFVLFGLGIPILVSNLFSPTYPRRDKLINALILSLGLIIIVTVLTLIIR